MEPSSAASRTIDLGVPLHFLEQPGEGPETLVLVHGLGGSHVNWTPVMDPLGRFGRVLAPDLGGFGLTPPGPSGTTVDGNLALLARFIDAEAPGGAVLFGNSMGGSLAILFAARYPEKVRALVLVSPACPLAKGARLDPAVRATFGLYLVPWVSAWAMRARRKQRGPEGLVRDLLALCYADASRIDPALVARHVALAEERAAMPWVEEAFLGAARSVVWLLLRPARFLAAVDAVRAPTLLVHGAHDRLVPVASARALTERRTDWSLSVMERAGHTPQLEVPEDFLGEVIPWLEQTLAKRRG